MTERAILSWRALVAGMGGRAGTVLVPTWNVFGAKDANGRRFNMHGNVRWGGDLDQDGLAFDLTGWGQDDSAVYATLAEDAALNASEIVVNYAPGIDGLRPGQYFGIGNRLHIVTQTWQTEANPYFNTLYTHRAWDDGRVWRNETSWETTSADEPTQSAPVHIRFTPWLREAAPAGTPVIIDRPVCLMRFAQDQTGELELDMGRWGSGGLEFVEAF